EWEGPREKQTTAKRRVSVSEHKLPRVSLGTPSPILPFPGPGNYLSFINRLRSLTAHFADQKGLEESGEAKNRYSAIVKTNRTCSSCHNTPLGFTNIAARVPLHPASHRRRVEAFLVSGLRATLPAKFARLVEGRCDNANEPRTECQFTFLVASHWLPIPIRPSLPALDPLLLRIIMVATMFAL
ncbi:hypothetical protein BaRGS_00025545, partial [Batillaria attramentaria]